MTKKKKIIIGAVVVSVILIFAFWKFQTKETIDDKYLIEEVRKENLSQTVSATGDLKSDGEVVLNFENVGRIDFVKVKVGDEVGEGEILASLSNDISSKQVEKAKIALDKAIAETGSNDDAIKELEQSVDNAEDYLDEIDSLENQKISAAEQALDDAEEYYEEAVEYYNRSVDEHGEGSSVAQSAKLTMKTAESNKNSAEQNLGTVRKAKDLAEVSAENSLKSAEQALKTAKSQYAKASRNAVVEAAQVDYEMALINLEKSSLKSPVNGVIAEINYKQGEVIGSSMGAIGFGKIISKDFILETLISESDIPKVQLNQQVELTFDALPFNEVVEAQVIEIEPAATKIQDVIYYKAKLKLNKIDARLKEGMSADVDILIDSRENVIAVSQSAIEYVATKSFVKVIDENGNIERRQVQLGLEGDNGMVEIREGLRVDERIVISEKTD